LDSFASLKSKTEGREIGKNNKKSNQPHIFRSIKLTFELNLFKIFLQYEIDNSINDYRSYSTGNYNFIYQANIYGLR